MSGYALISIFKFKKAQPYVENYVKRETNFALEVSFGVISEGPQLTNAAWMF